MRRFLTAPQLRGGDEHGFGLVEILVSMTLLAIILAALAPLLVNSVRVSARNATIAYGTQLVNRQIELARSQSTTCADFTTFLQTVPATETDPRGTSLAITRTPAPATVSAAVAAGTWTCPTATGVQKLAVSVTNVSTGQVLADATTLIAVPGLK
jgi:prepilin-type N-terminal cleavage/methylation domain-containing protein